MQSFKPLRIPVALFTVSAFMLGVFMLTDTSAYRTALNATTSPTFVQRLQTDQSNILRDISATEKCLALRQINPTSYSYLPTPASRNCIVATAGTIKTSVGALVVAESASKWLEAHPADEEMRSAGLAAINQARSELASQRVWYYGTMEKIAEAHNRSVFLRIKDGLQDYTDEFINWAEMLDKAEFSVRLPGVVRSHNEWLLQQLKVGVAK